MRKQLLALIAGSAALAGCHAHASGGGPTISRNYQVGNFQQIEVAGPYDVEVRTGGNPGVSARGPEKILEQTVVEVQGNKLIIHQQEHHGFSLFSFGTHGGIRFVVTVPQLTAATLAGS